MEDIVNEIMHLGWLHGDSLSHQEKIDYKNEALKKMESFLEKQK